jgi:hypothetical protein
MKGRKMTKTKGMNQMTTMERKMMKTRKMAQTHPQPFALMKWMKQMI